MKRILAPHKEQDGWAYWRVRVTTAKSAANAQAVNPLWLIKKDTLECVKASDICLGVGYSDDTPGSRIISSRRVEEAVETADFLKLLTSEGLYASYWPDGEWLVSNTGLGVGVAASGATLREAYYRYKADEPDYRTCKDCAYGSRLSQWWTSGADEPCLSCVQAATPDGEWSRPGYKAQAGDAE